MNNKRNKIITTVLITAVFCAVLKVVCFADPYSFSVPGESTKHSFEVKASDWAEDNVYLRDHLGKDKNITAEYDGESLDMSAKGVSENTLISVIDLSGSAKKDANGDYDKSSVDNPDIKFFEILDQYPYVPFVIKNKTYRELSLGADKKIEPGVYSIKITYMPKGAQIVSGNALFLVTNAATTDPTTDPTADPKPLYNGKETAADWYKDQVAITASGFTVCDSASGTYANSYVLKGTGKGVTKKLYFRTSASQNAVEKTVGPVNFDNKAPEGKIEVDDDSWKKLQTEKKEKIFINESQKAEITGQDESDGSGIGKIYYYISNKCYTDESDVDKNFKDKWKEYSSKVSLTKNKLNFVYAKITDKAGNISYISTEGIWYDEKKPEVTSVKGTAGDGSASVTVKGKDSESGIKYYYCSLVKKGDSAPDAEKVKSGGKKTEDGEYDFSGLEAGGTYTAYAVIEDKAGNLSAVKSKKITIKGEKEKSTLTSSSGTGSSKSSGTGKSTGTSSVSSGSASKNSSGGGSSVKYPSSGSSSKKTSTSGKSGSSKTSSGKSSSKKTASGNSSKKTASGNDTKKKVSGNSASGNSASGNTASDNKASGKPASGNGISENKKKTGDAEVQEKISQAEIKSKIRNAKSLKTDTSEKKNAKKNERKPVNIKRMLLFILFIIGIVVFVIMRFGTNRNKR